MRQFRRKKTYRKKRTWSYRYGYYNYVRLTVSAASLYGLYIVRDMENHLWRCVFIALLVLYNNIKPLRLTSEIWNTADIVAAAVILISFWII